MSGCRVCGKVVSAKQQALECDRCHGWVHRLCGTGMSQKEYRELMRRLKEGGEFEWVCGPCSTSGMAEAVVAEAVVEGSVMAETVMEGPVIAETVVAEAVMAETMMEGSAKAVTERSVMAEAVVEGSVMDETVMEGPVIAETVVAEAVMEGSAKAVTERSVMAEAVMEGSVMDDSEMALSILVGAAVGDMKNDDSNVGPPLLESTRVKISASDSGSVIHTYTTIRRRNKTGAGDSLFVQLDNTTLMKI